jgi:HD-GYP domain-containing protein (c-di-GMP phosphodiesterase class II)
MFDYDSARHIKILNKYLGMEHRIEKHNLMETSELKAALEYAVAAYLDYDHYRNTLGSLVENFDESVEYFDTATWVNMTRANENADDLVMDCVNSLSETHDYFDDLAEQAEMHLSSMLKITLTAPTAAQLEILGKSFDIAPSDIDNWLEGLFVALTYVNHHHSIPDNYNEFLAVINAGWEES